MFSLNANESTILNTGRILNVRCMLMHLMVCVGSCHQYSTGQLCSDEGQDDWTGDISKEGEPLPAQHKW